MNSLKKSIAQEFKDSKQFSLFDAYESFPEKPHETVRARIYDGLGIVLYKMIHSVLLSRAMVEICLS